MAALNTGKTSNAEKVDDAEPAIDALLAKAEEIWSNPDAFLPVNENVDAELAAA